MIFSFTSWGVQEKPNGMEKLEGIRIGDARLDGLTSTVPEKPTIFWLPSHSSKNIKYKK